MPQQDGQAPQSKSESTGGATEWLSCARIEEEAATVAAVAALSTRRRREVAGPRKLRKPGCHCRPSVRPCTEAREAAADAIAAPPPSQHPRASTRGPRPATLPPAGAPPPHQSASGGTTAPSRPDRAATKTETGGAGVAAREARRRRGRAKPHDGACGGDVEAVQGPRGEQPESREPRRRPVAARVRRGRARGDGTARRRWGFGEGDRREHVPVSGGTGW